MDKIRYRDFTKEELISMLKKVRSEQVAVLGEGECFIRRTEKGFVESVRVPINLRESKGEIYKIGEKWGISADGYDKLNQAAGLSIVAPKSISPIEQDNPHFESDDKGNLKYVTVRRVVVGPSPIGNMVAIERLLRFDVAMYFLEDLQNKVNRRAGCGGYGTHDARPSVMEGKSSAVMFRLGPAALWVDVSHADIQEAFREHIKRCKFAERMATRMCERNAFASHPAIARRHVEPVGGVARVTVFGGKSIVDEERIKELVKVFEEGDFEKAKDVEVLEAEGVDTPELEEVISVAEEIEEEAS